jgi:hypothetical protein
MFIACIILTVGLNLVSKKCLTILKNSKTVKAKFSYVSINCLNRVDMVGHLEAQLGCSQEALAI